MKRKIDVKQAALSAAIVLVVAAQAYYCISSQEEATTLKQTNTRLQTELNSMNLRFDDTNQTIARLEEDLKAKSLETEALAAELQNEKQKREVKQPEVKTVKPAKG